MTIGQLMAELQKYPAEYIVRLPLRSNGSEKADKVDEVKLVHFSECDPMCFPANWRCTYITQEEYEISRPVTKEIFKEKGIIIRP